MNRTSFPDAFEHHSPVVRALIKLGVICFVVGAALLLRDMWGNDQESRLPAAKTMTAGSVL